LLDLNVLIALLDRQHTLHRKARDWFISSDGESWGLCPITESGFIRVMASPVMQASQCTTAEAADILRELATRPGYCYWPITDSWNTLTAPFADRIFGHQQVTDAYLLGLAIKNDGVLVTFDKAIRFLAGAEFSRNLHILE